MNPETRWDRTVKQFKNSSIGLLLLTLVAGVTFYGDLADFWERLVPSKEQSNLLLTEVSRKPLEGYQTVKRGGTEDTIFLGGAVTKFTLQHNGKGDVPVSIHGITIEVSEFVPGQVKELDRKRSLDRTLGRGTEPVHRFTVSLAGSEVKRVKWSRKDIPPLLGKNANLLDTLSENINLNKSMDSEPVEVTLRPKEVGSYKVHFRFEYVAEGRNQEKVTEPLVIYRGKE